MQFADKWFFQSPFDANEMFCLHNKSVLFTNHKQPLWTCDQIPYVLSDKKFICQ